MVFSPGKDKAAHFGASAGLTMVGAAVLTLLMPVAQAVTLGAICAGAVGILKEVIDARRPGGTGFDPMDLAADACGIALGAAVAMLIL